MSVIPAKAGIHEKVNDGLGSGTEPLAEFIPAQAGNHEKDKYVDAGLHRHDEMACKKLAKQL